MKARAPLSAPEGILEIKVPRELAADECPGPCHCRLHEDVAHSAFNGHTSVGFDRFPNRPARAKVVDNRCARFFGEDPLHPPREQHVASDGPSFFIDDHAPDQHRRRKHTPKSAACSRTASCTGMRFLSTRGFGSCTKVPSIVKVQFDHFNTWNTSPKDIQEPCVLPCRLMHRWRSSVF